MHNTHAHAIMQVLHLENKTTCHHYLHQKHRTGSQSPSTTYMYTLYLAPNYILLIGKKEIGPWK